jgi:hypothetical protein
MAKVVGITYVFENSTWRPKHHTAFISVSSKSLGVSLAESESARIWEV